MNIDNDFDLVKYAQGAITSVQDDRPVETLPVASVPSAQIIPETLESPMQITTSSTLKTTNSVQSPQISLTATQQTAKPRNIQLHSQLAQHLAAAAAAKAKTTPQQSKPVQESLLQPTSQPQSILQAQVQTQAQVQAQAQVLQQQAKPQVQKIVVQQVTQPVQQTASPQHIIINAQPAPQAVPTAAVSQVNLQQLQQVCVHVLSTSSFFIIILDSYVVDL